MDNTLAVVNYPRVDWAPVETNYRNEELSGAWFIAFSPDVIVRLHDDTTETEVQRLQQELERIQDGRQDNKR